MCLSTDAGALSLWFKLFQMLDPTEAARAAAVAPAPAPGVLAKRGSDGDFRDNDFLRRFVEQYCASFSALLTLLRLLRSRALAAAGAGWRKTNLCSRCFVPSTNAAIHAWKVRLCSPCIAASILNKSASTLLQRFRVPHRPLRRQLCSVRSRLQQDVHAHAD